MRKIYALAPLIALGIFGAAYANYAAGRESRLALQRAREEADRQQKARETREARAQAHASAIAAQAVRARELAEKIHHDEEQKSARLAEEQRGQAASAQAAKLRTQLERLRAECERTEAAVARAEERQRELGREQHFLSNCLRRAEENHAVYRALWEKVEAAERVRPAPASAQPSRGVPPRQTG